MYGMALVGFLFIMCARRAAFAVAAQARPCASTRALAPPLRSWLKRESVSETRKRVTKHLREIDTPVNEDNWVQMTGASIGQY
jgi:hypothetical protein